LLQLTLGAPQVVYNGGLLMARVRYFDGGRKRPGLPEDVAALVEKLEAERTVLQLVNLSLVEAREVIVQAGAFAEHQFTKIKYRTRLDGQVEEVEVEVNDKCFHVHLMPGSGVTLDIGMNRFVNDPTYTGSGPALRNLSFPSFGETGMFQISMVSINSTQETQSKNF
jgi:hypothetical protein